MTTWSLWVWYATPQHEYTSWLTFDRSGHLAWLSSQCIVRKRCNLPSPPNHAIAYIYWDLGGDLTQLGNPQAIPGLVEIQSKVIIWAPPWQQCIIAHAPTGIAHRRSHMGNCSLLHPCFNTNSISPNLLFHTMVPHNNLRDPCPQRSLLRYSSSSRSASLPTYIDILDCSCL